MAARDGMMGRAAVSRPLAALAVMWTVVPLAVVALRATAAAWPFPRLVPADVAGGVTAPAGALLAPLATSLVLAGVTALLATPAAFLLARHVSRLPAQWRTAGILAAFLPVVAPPVPLGVGVQLVALRTGLAGTAAGVLLTHLVPALGYAVLALLAAMRDDDWRAEEAARTLGADARTVLVRVSVPRYAGALAATALLAALVSWGQVATTLLVGEGAVRTLAVEALAVTRSGDDRAAALAVLLLALPPLALLALPLRARSRTAGA